VTASRALGKFLVKSRQGYVQLRRISFCNINRYSGPPCYKFDTSLVGNAANARATPGKVALVPLGINVTNTSCFMGIVE